MTYRNKKTGMVVNTTCEVQGANWVEVKTQQSASAPDNTEGTKTTTKKPAATTGKSKAKGK